MGRKTWESLPGKLPEREHYVLSRKNNPDLDIISYEDALNMEGWIIGGGEIYELFLPHVKYLYRTIIDTRVDDADTFFPDITGMGFTLESEMSKDAGPKDQHDMTFQVWVRK